MYEMEMKLTLVDIETLVKKYNLYAESMGKEKIQIVKGSESPTSNNSKVHRLNAMNIQGDQFDVSLALSELFGRKVRAWEITNGFVITDNDGTICKISSVPGERYEYRANFF